MMMMMMVICISMVACCFAVCSLQLFFIFVKNSRSE